MLEIKTLSSLEKIYFACLYYAQLNSEDSRYKKKWSKVKKALSIKYSRNENTIKNDKDYLDAKFDNNGRMGWRNKPLERSKFAYEFYNKYKDLPLNELEEIVEQIKKEAAVADIPIFAVKISKNKSTVESILKKGKNIELDGLNIYKDLIRKKTPVFVVLGGDSSKKEVTWGEHKGLIAIGTVVTEPYTTTSDKNKNFRIKIDIKYLFDSPIKREDLISYADTYDIEYIGPELNRDHTQAIAKISEVQTSALIRAIIEIFPNAEKNISKLFNKAILQKAKGAATILVPYKLNYKEELVHTDESEKNTQTDTITESYLKSDFLSEIFTSDENYEILKTLLLNNKNIILQGAPGTGKTYIAKRLAYSILEEKNHNHIEIIQFHQSYSYEDFILGYKPNGNCFDLKKGPFYKFCEKAAADKERPYFFIIDEINRGNISKIFGETMMLMEADKRDEESVKLLYNEENFTITPNLHIIGTMNTADRSLAIMDYALRRRFKFISIEPAFETVAFKTNLLNQGVPERVVLKIINNMKKLNTMIKEDINLGNGYRIGHSYFCSYDAAENWYENIINYEIKPLLEEYWFDDLSKVDDIIQSCLR